MTHKPLISVIVPAFNVAAFLDTSLASAAAQTYSNLEVIVVNNGSSDETPQIAQCWAEKDSRFISVRQTLMMCGSRKNSLGKWIY
jgi:glycosyltransferase involved in cell wall biosynthesis